MASCSIFLSNVAYLDIVIVDNPQVLTVIWVTFSLSSFLMLLITFLIQNGALRQSADSLSPARPSSHSSLVQDPSLPPPSRPFLPDLLSMGLALMRTAEIMNAITITLEEIILCLFCVSNLKSIHPIKPIYLMSNIEVRLEDTPGCPPAGWWLWGDCVCVYDCTSSSTPLSPLCQVTTFPRQELPPAATDQSCPDTDTDIITLMLLLPQLKVS